MRRARPLALVLLGLAALLPCPAAATIGPTVLVVVVEKVMGVFDTTGFEEPHHVEAIAAAALGERGLAVLDLDTVQRGISLAKARQLLEGDEITAREVALQEEAEYLLIGTATSKPAGSRLFGTSMQSLQAVVALRLIRSGDGRVLAAASTRAAEAHIDEVQGGVLALTAATEEAIAELAPVLDGLVRPAPGELTLQIDGLVSYRHLDFLLGYLRREMSGVEEARLRDFDGGVAVIGLATSTSAERIARAAVGARFTGFRLRATHVTPGRIELEAVLEE